MNKEDLDAILKGKKKIESLTAKEQKTALKMLKQRRDEIDKQLKLADPTASVEKEVVRDWSVPEFTWIARKRRDIEDGFSWTEYWLLHGSGRIMAVVEIPSDRDPEAPFHAEIKAVLYHHPDWDHYANEFGFLNLEDAQHWCEQIVSGNPPEMDCRVDDDDYFEDDNA